MQEDHADSAKLNPSNSGSAMRGGEGKRKRMQCGNCGGENIEEARFCESCGAKLAAEAPAAVGPKCRCGAGPEKRDAQGFCQQCGRRGAAEARTALPRDHVEIELLPAFAAVTDRGRKHHRNEDACAIARTLIRDEEYSILIVCDGVSSSQDADAASETAANAAMETLKSGEEPAFSDAEPALRDALIAAHRAVCQLPHSALTGKDPPLTTMVAALAYRNEAVIGWIGDSRAYLIAGDEIRQLTKDHSWQNMVVDAGEMTPEEAAIAPQAHAITQCLGLWADGVPEDLPTPGIASVALAPGSRLLLCTDGLWNYASTPEALRDVIAAAPEGETALGLCRRLTNFANAAGGHDNITVAVLSQ